MAKPEILFLSMLDYVERERMGLVEALQPHATVTCLDSFRDHAVDAVEAATDRPPDLVLHPDTYRVYLPEGIEELDCPTACLHIDTYSASANRARMSLLFDLAFVCHPGYPEFFEEQGHPEPLLFPHAVRAPLYKDPLPKKTLDIAMVGRLEGAQYSYRRSCMQAIRRLDVSNNEFGRYYEYQEMTEVYRQAKIGLNVSRDDHLADANLRCFEVMGGGALLMTPLPSELSELGVVEGKHFIGYQSIEELREKVKYYLRHDTERQTIASRGRDITLRQFTYDRWADRIINRIEEGIPAQAPARIMREDEVASIYVDYFSKRGHIDETLQHLRRQRKADGLGCLLLRSTAKAAKATIRGWQRALTS